MLTVVSSAASQLPPVSKATAAMVADKVNELEASIDQSISLSASLARAIIKARQESDLPVHAGQLALMRLQRAQAQLVAAASDTFRAHDELSRLAKTLMIWEDPTNLSGLLGSDAELDQVA